MYAKDGSKIEPIPNIGEVKSEPNTVNENMTILLVAVDLYQFCSGGAFIPSSRQMQDCAMLQICS